VIPVSREFVENCHELNMKKPTSLLAGCCNKCNTWMTIGSYIISPNDTSLAHAWACIGNFLPRSESLGVHLYQPLVSGVLLSASHPMCIYTLWPLCRYHFSTRWRRQIHVYINIYIYTYIYDVHSCVYSFYTISPHHLADSLHLDVLIYPWRTPSLLSPSAWYCTPQCGAP
jgi:hypothetical protein